MARQTLTLERYVRLTAADMLAGLRDGTFLARDLVEAAAEVMARLEPALNSHFIVDVDGARRIATERDAETRGGRSRGALHGLPLSIKDTYDIPGVRSARGSRLYADTVATQASPLSQRVLDAGAIMMGKTTMPEFGWKASSTSPLTGVTRNPWNPALTTGGSSSGSAAAVAARMVPVALGGDGGGSIRIPAAFCGVYGQKPSFGRVAVWPGSVHDQLVHHGFLTRTARDTALMLDVGKGPDPRDPWSLPADPTSLFDGIAASTQGLRIGVALRPWGIEPDADVAAVLDQVRQHFTPLGWQPHDVPLPGSLPKACFEVLWSCSRAFTSGPTLDADATMLDPALVRSVRLGLGYGLNDYLRAALERRRFAGLFQSVFDQVDVLVLPTVPIKPFAAEADIPEGWSDEGVLPWIDWSPYTYPFNLTGNPAASLPAGFTPEGRPVGLQIVGPRFRDDLVLRAAHALEVRIGIGDTMPGMTRALVGGSGP
jgi:aspartyl-tRNA(Asn)/glutamyl-tRNA(Gln) amidotransferase subunit A